MKNILKKITSLALGAILLASCGAKSNEEGKTDAKSGEKLTIGIVQIADHPSLDAAREGFIEKLDESGLAYELVDHRANGDLALIPQFASDLKNKKADLIYTIGTPAAQGVANAITDLPILFSAVTDPVGAGLVDENTKFGANITGVSDYVEPGKLIVDFLKLYPDTKTFGTIYNTNEQNSVVQIEALEKALGERGLKLEKQGVSTINDMPQAISSLKSKIDAMFTVTDNVVVNAMPVLSENLNKDKIPSIACDEGSVENGALISEGVNYKDCGKKVGEMAVSILKDGKAIKDIPYQDAESLKTLVNKKTAEILGLDLNKEVLKDAEYIEK
ncbi:ABC transporter substrate-binding protein [Anaerococcus kampingiae]|uniref:ABC transporter substrate-binding protein n=1 Tax=Anaerococcus kampingae TaxID=3115614 RepID=A0ABW9MAC0_9FIRM